MYFVLGRLDILSEIPQMLSQMLKQSLNIIYIQYLHFAIPEMMFAVFSLSLTCLSNVYESKQMHEFEKHDDQTDDAHGL